MNGTEYAGDQPLYDPGFGPVTIVITFPFAIDRASVDQWTISGQHTKTWMDDRTLRLVFGESEPISFKFADVRSATGDATIDFLAVTIPRTTRLVSVYTLRDLAAAGRDPPRASGTWRVPHADGVALVPDARAVLLYDGFGPGSGPAPTFVDLDTKRATPLGQPPADDGWFSYADWMADGRLVMVGRSVWVGGGPAAGTSAPPGLRRIADAVALVAGYPWVALPDPAERRIAIWGYNADGHIALVDLASGATQRISGPFRRCGADGFTSFAWSADGRLLAGVDCDGEEGPAKARVRIVDVASDRTLRTVERGIFAIRGLPDGTFVIVRESGETGAGARMLGQVVGFDGVERARYLGHDWLPSRDGRHLLQVRWQPAGGPDYTLFDLVAKTSFEFVVPCGGRSEGGCGSPHWLRDGRLAFY